MNGDFESNLSQSRKRFKKVENGITALFLVALVFFSSNKITEGRVFSGYLSLGESVRNFSELSLNYIYELPSVVIIRSVTLTKAGGEQIVMYGKDSAAAVFSGYGTFTTAVGDSFSEFKKKPVPETVRTVETEDSLNLSYDTVVANVGAGIKNGSIDFNRDVIEIAKNTLSGVGEVLAEYQNGLKEFLTKTNNRITFVTESAANGAADSFASISSVWNDVLEIFADFFGSQENVAGEAVNKNEEIDFDNIVETEANINTEIDIDTEAVESAFSSEHEDVEFSDSISYTGPQRIIERIVERVVVSDDLSTEYVEARLRGLESKLLTQIYSISGPVTNIYQDRTILLDLEDVSDAMITGPLRDTTGVAGSSGEVLQTTGAGVEWVATSTLGFASASQISLGTEGQIAFYDADGTNLSATSSLRILQNGNIGIGITNPLAKLHIGGTDGIIIPVGTTLERPAGVTGVLRYNTTTSQFEGYNGSSWSGLGGVTDVDQDTFILAESSAGADEDTLFFNTGGLERLRIDASGNVAIGTSTADARLRIDGTDISTDVLKISVNGSPTYYARYIPSMGNALRYEQVVNGSIVASTFRNTNASVSSALLSLQNAGTGAHITTFGTNENLRIQPNGVGNTLLNYSGGNVGIGTITPNTLLHLVSSTTQYGSSITLENGNSSSYPFLRFYDSNENYSYAIGLDDSNNKLSIGYASASNATSLTNTRLTIDWTGNVGIGTTNPGVKLDVVGAVKISDTVNDATAKYSHIFGAQYLNANGDWTVLRSVAASGLNAIEIGGGNSGYDSATELRFYTSSAVNTLAGTQRMVIDNQGNVGIGVTSPSALLHIRGLDPVLYLNSNGGSSASLKYDSTNSFLLTDGTTNFVRLDNVGSGNDFHIRSRNSSDSDLIFETGNSAARMTVTYGGNVGIGTITPLQKLHVAGNSLFDDGSNSGKVLVGSVSNFPGIWLGANTVTPSLTNYSFLFDAGAAGGTIFNAPGTNNMTFRIGNSTKMFVSGSTGDIGIGTTTPSYKLDVYGDVRIKNNSAIKFDSLAGLATDALKLDTGDNLILNTPASGDVYIRSNSNNIARFLSNGAVNLGGLNATTNSFVSITNTGNVGIGTTSPSSLFYVQGASASGLPVATIQSNVAGGELLYLKGETGNDVFEFESAGTGGRALLKMYSVGVLTNVFNAIGDSYINGGNVGIGTTTPQTKLHISGTDNKLRLAYNSVNYSDLSTDELGNLILAPSSAKTYYGSFGQNNAIYLLDFLGTNRWAQVQGDGIGLIDGGVAKLQLSSTADSFFNSGNVGIGTASPSDKLHVMASSGTATGLRMENTGGSGFVSIISNSGSASDLRFGDSGGDAGRIRYNHLDDSMAFYTNGLERYKVTSSGNFGIGTTSPNAKLTIHEGVANINTYIDSDSVLFTRASDGAANAGISYSGSTLTLNNAGGGAITRFTGNDGVGNMEVMRIHSNGNLGIGTTSPWRKLSVSGNVGFDGLTAAVASGSALCLDANNEVQVNSGAQTCTVSSARFKDSIEYDSISGLDTILALKPATFKYKNTDITRIGFIAEDVNLIDERLVFTESDMQTLRGVRYEDMTAILAKAIQEIFAEFTNFKAAVAERFTTKELCLEEVCINKEQLRGLLENSNTAPATSGSGATTPETESVTGNATTTEAAIEDNTPVAPEETPGETNQEGNTTAEVVVGEVTETEGNETPIDTQNESPAENVNSEAPTADTTSSETETAPSDNTSETGTTEGTSGV